MSQRTSNLRLALALGVASFVVWAAYVLIRLLDIA